MYMWSLVGWGKEAFGKTAWERAGQKAPKRSNVL